MSAYSNIDRETFRWVRTEVEVTLDRARLELQRYIRTDKKEDLLELINHLHQIVGSLQMLELKSMSTLMLESESLIEDYSQTDSEIDKSAFVVVLDSAFSILSSGFDLIEQGSPERPIEVVELINQIREIRGLEDIEIGALFTPMIEVFPEVISQRALKDSEYIYRAKALRKLYQAYLLQWLQNSNGLAAEKISLVFDKLSQMSTFGSVSRIWWVATAYADYLRTNKLKNKSVHGRVLRELNDRLSDLGKQGESALVRDPGEELIRVMLLYIAMSDNRTDKMDEIFTAFSLGDYFPAVESEADLAGFARLSNELKKLSEEINAPLARVRELTAQYFEGAPDNQMTSADNDTLDSILDKLGVIVSVANKYDLDVITELLDESRNTIKGLRNDTIKADDSTAFYLASALMFVDSSITKIEEFDRNALNNGEQKLKSIRALNNNEEPNENVEEFSKHDRQALLDAVGSEVVDSIQEIETRVEAFSEDYERTDLLSGADKTIRQIKGAVQVLGDQKLSLFLQLVEDQFAQIDSGETEATPHLIEALAISIGVTEEYVRGLQNGRSNLDILLDRGHSDLEVAVGKKVSRADVETLLDESSDSLFSWLAEQSDFELFSQLKLNLRDLSTLARKTGMTNLDQIIREQNRMIDIISQEPAYLTDNITSNLQNNMATITEQLLQLYGTEDTEEELAKEAQKVYRRSAIEDDEQGPQIHDDMDVSSLGEDIQLEAKVEDVSLTEIGKRNAVDDEQNPPIDDVIFEAFIEESGDILESADDLYSQCMEDPNNRDAARDLRRAFHTLKGSSRMVGLNKVGEVAWFSESLFNYVLDTEKSLTPPILEFARDALDTIRQHSEHEYANQHQIDVDAWGVKTEKVPLDGDPEPTLNQPLSENQDTVTEGREIVADDIFVADEVIELQSVSGFDLDDDISIGTFDLQSSLELDDDSELEDNLEIEDNLEPESGSSSFAENNSQDVEEELELVDINQFNESDFIDLNVTEESVAATDDDLETVSFLAIEDRQMRSVFVQEAELSLMRLEDRLGTESLTIKDDDALPISVHTLLGNARTMGLVEVAEAFDEAENFCDLKKQSADTFSDKERSIFKDLVALTRSCVESVQDSEPYFHINKEGWDKSAEELQSLAKNYQSIDADVEILESDQDIEIIEDVIDSEPVIEIQVPDSFLDGASELLLDEDDLDIDFSNQADEIEKELANRQEVPSDELDTLSDEEIMPERLAAAFKDLDITDDDELLNDEQSSAVDEFDSELADLEKSLGEFNDQELSDDDSSDTINVDAELNEGDSEIITARESLIPDDLTNLLEDDLLELDSTIEFVDIAQNEKKQVSENVESSVNQDEQKPSVEEELSVTEEPSVEEEKRDEDQVSQEASDGLEEDSELRGVFLEELKSLHNELDNDVASMQSLEDTPTTMTNIMRNLHTIKGSALMASADTLGSLTHDVESYLENTFIRKDDDLRDVRKTLELYIDSIDVAAEAYKNNVVFKVSAELIEKLPARQPTIDKSEQETKDDVGELESNKTEVELDEAPDLALHIEELTKEIIKTENKWKSARGWKKIQVVILSVYEEYESLIKENDQLQSLSTLLSYITHYAESLKLKSAAEFKQAKSVLQDAHEILNHNANALMSGKTIKDTSSISAQLIQPEEEEPKIAEESPSDTPQSLFVPAVDEVDDEDLDELQAQAKAAQERAAQLKIKTETLDSLTNYVGDASMNRSQMREDVLSIKNVVEELYSNVARFGNQLRELEIEADSRISSRTNESVAPDRGEEFDPLELDRYTKLQQLSRGLTENLDDLNDIQGALTSFVNKTEASLQKQDRLNRELQDEIMQVRLVSFGGLGPQLRRIARRTASELEKDVELEIIGSEVRMDKTILDGVAPALEHMLRNAIDHGIELPEVRKKKKKSATGKIIIGCRQVAREIIISVSDDGAGLDLEKIRSKAIENKLLTADQDFKSEDILMYISQSGFTTAASLTQISGRGVGMDVVQSTLRRMSGSISYDTSNEQIGSQFTISLPISLTVSSAMFVHAGDEQFAIAARTIERVINVEADQLITLLKAEKPVIEAGNQHYSLIDLAEYLGYRTDLPDSDQKLSVVLVSAGVQNVAVIVDGLDDTQEIVVKNLGSHLDRIPIYSGATIRADGRVVLLLDLIGISYYESVVSVSDAALDDSKLGGNIPTILVVDDSLTVRKSAERDINGLGINVVLEKDGVDAQTQLRETKPDMILLDIEMPRMDGFEFLEWIKSEDNLKEIPVVMISSRATEKYVDKATKLGCSAFLGKPYLLENLVSVFNQFLQLDTPIKLDRDNN